MKYMVNFNLTHAVLRLWALVITRSITEQRTKQDYRDPGLVIGDKDVKQSGLCSEAKVWASAEHHHFGGFPSDAKLLPIPPTLSYITHSVYKQWTHCRILLVAKSSYTTASRYQEEDHRLYTKTTFVAATTQNDNKNKQHRDSKISMMYQSIMDISAVSWCLLLLLSNILLHLVSFTLLSWQACCWQVVGVSILKNLNSGDLQGNNFILKN